jgi:hypothetical protein
VEGQRFDGCAAAPLQGVGPRHQVRAALPLARSGQGRHRIGEDLTYHMRRMVVRISNRQASPEGLPAHQPAIDAEVASDRLEGVDVAGHAIRCWIFGHRRATVPPQLDDHRPDVLLQSRKIRPPLRAARQKAMNQKEVWAPAPWLHFRMKLHVSDH